MWFSDCNMGGICRGSATTRQEPRCGLRIQESSFGTRYVDAHKGLHYTAAKDVFSIAASIELMEPGEAMYTIHATSQANPPCWALQERHLIDTMNRAAVEYVERYTRPDGTFVWRDDWPGLDGSDDGYESYTSFPLFYALGGGEHIHELARKQWEAVTRQFTGFGQVYNEFDAYYDWMHHGESSLYLYYLALADPHALRDRDRALRFAGMYMGEDPEADNWDSERKLIRSPINGSRGPRFEMSAVDWVTHRPVLAEYLAPYEDLAPELATNPLHKVNWNDDAIFAEVLKLLNQRMARGDVPLNLTSTSLITNAYLYTGEEKYRQWVLEYVDAWKKRTAQNNGITPDNVGLSGEIGECMNGKWWGGYYGWRWPHGAVNILEATLIAGYNALLLTGDESHLDLIRSQLDLLWSLGKEEDGVFKIPARHGDCGWFDYRPPDPRLYIHLYYVSQQPQDRERLNRLPGREQWAGSSRFGKGAQYHPAAWFAFNEGDNPDYPERVLEAHYQEVCRRMELLRNDHGDPNQWDVHHWQEINPVACEGLVQLMTGSPGVVYHGGLLHCRVRYFDPVNKRPGLPEHVAAMVLTVNPDNVVLMLVNCDPVQPHEVILQAGAFGEHRFTEVFPIGEDRPVNLKSFVNGPHVQVQLHPASQVLLRAKMDRFANKPTYAFPWETAQEDIH
ncbi:MAG: hypothetical protein COZ56_08965 [Armatimonadetes bacterium CG_4_8_14_3_um_filter_58_9]|nr:MAG: hypothetical protein COZ56_08965 [Armatimonadetes bacterium CG_4_8_14_3_um_filter_58_9]PJB61821.1 MAG: hypothetical protein CO095_19935 [Armatimonadetes bacterium CG_4_9_14_3_um_filter_58_7]